jgi:hypothetical protein
VLELVIDRAAARLRISNRAFSRHNLFHAFRRLVPARAGTKNFENFVDGPLAARLRAGPIDGLLPPPAGDGRRRLPHEWDAYFPAMVLMVDRREIVDLFAASGVLVQARMAVVCTDGSPAPVIAWLRRGLRAGHRAPFGYLHDAATVLYPFSLEPFATLFRVLGGEPARVVDLGLPPDGLPRRALGRGGAASERVFELEAVEPSTLISWATRRLGALQPRDSWLEPIDPVKKDKQ